MQLKQMLLSAICYQTQWPWDYVTKNYEYVAVQK